MQKETLKLEVLPSGKYCLLADYSFTGIYGFNTTVDKGFITDLATIPRYFWRYIAPTDIPYSAVIHDYLLIQLKDENIKPRFKRLALWKQANGVMYSAMHLSPKKIPLWRKIAIKWAIDLNATIKCVIFNKQPSEI